MPQPAIHRHITCVAAPAIWLSPPSGQLTGGVDGLYVAERRVLSRFVVTVDGREPEPVEAGPLGANGARFTGSAGALAVERVRTVTPEGGTEQITLRNTGDTPAAAVLRIAAAGDLASISTVRRGEDPGLPHTPLDDGVEWTRPEGQRVRLDGRTYAEVSLAPGETFSTTVTVRATPPDTPGFRPAPPAGRAPWARAPLAVRSGDERLDRLVAQGVDDLGALLLAYEGDFYCAAGSPWYLTLFGRDALWTARLALPLGHELAAGTLRVLARHQGDRHDPGTEEEPGKIPHELRPGDATTWLPPLYYGTVDATPLFVVTLAEARRWGMPDAEVAALMPAVERALEWLGTFDGGFVSYTGRADRLANQGWKDSDDGVQHADGRPARPPIALSEVQAYAYQAAALGADLLDAFGRPGGARWRRWAADLAERFRARFWVDGYPAIALDGDGRPVDGVASNLGHLLGTGLLTPDEETEVARRLIELDSGWGLRTLSPDAAGFDPLSYHLGSVWPHDTAIAILGLVRTGHHEFAARLARGLIAAAPSFGHRLPELFGGHDSSTPPVPYPTACSPQAWAAAVSPALVTALLGLDPNLPAGRIALAPMPGIGELSVDNIRIGSAVMSARLTTEGHATLTGAPQDAAVKVTP
ncbi:glycogen debranching N-terminal domain-containing protein [Actinomadura sp. WMMA1423]|uniref:glycogen debranching N-terminal domain-containing protein n=1 Tax=Actinomadura sp. WMMA1423 TaxID=2591108 RepID=UPI001146502B|nr:glycogen debranching N-terminal domain-containing protein [Actinomadura sp. WMMA1423]